MNDSVCIRFAADYAKKLGRRHSYIGMVETRDTDKTDKDDIIKDCAIFLGDCAAKLGRHDWFGPARLDHFDLLPRVSHYYYLIFK